MSNLSDQLDKIASDKGVAGKCSTLLAVAALVLLDKNNDVVFDPEDLAGTVSRLRAAASTNGVADLEGEQAPYNDPVQASVSPTLPGNNNDLTFTAIPIGTAGNDIFINYIDPGDIDIALSVVLSGGGRSIDITLATDHDGVITTTPDDIAALLADSELVTVANAPANDGSGVVSAFSFQLNPGHDITGLGVAGTGSRFTDYGNGNLYINQGDKDAPNWVQLAVAV